MIIACWSGPRNLSTALMYAFSSRADCDVRDEPFYAAYLAATGLDHPMRAEILAAGPTDPALVARDCAAPPPPGRLIYQKHMTHHMLPAFDQGWFAAAAHIFLIRHPARVLASYRAKRGAPSLSDIGFVQQSEIFATIRAQGLPWVVVDSFDIRAAPDPVLRQVCAGLGIAWDPAMLAWAKGGNPADGVWAAHWYDAVHRSTTFAGAEAALPDLPGPLGDVQRAAMPHYQALKAHAIQRTSP